MLIALEWHHFALKYILLCRFVKILGGAFSLFTTRPSIVTASHRSPYASSAARHRMHGILHATFPSAVYRSMDRMPTCLRIHHMVLCLGIPYTQALCLRFSISRRSAHRLWLHLQLAPDAVIANTTRISHARNQNRAAARMEPGTNNRWYGAASCMLLLAKQMK
jgi:hypothetical protein